VSDPGPDGTSDPAPVDPGPARGPVDPHSTPGPVDPRSVPTVVDPRRYGAWVGVLAVVLVIAFAIYALTSKGTGSAAGIPAGQPLRYFAAPLANTTLNGDANLDPPCTLARHDPRALNICLIAKRSPLVLGFFVTGSASCEREVTTMQALSAEPANRQVVFAAVAVDDSHSATAVAIRKHHWTIPVAYDADGGAGGLYGVTACPLLELAYRGGTVAARLIGNHWLQSAALGAQVEALVRR
jgi:peroxiredoxin